VETVRLSPTRYRVVLDSRGTVRPAVATTLVSEVGGTITALADGFVVGGAFAAGTPLVQLDERDYAIALTRARATLAQAAARLEEERALAEQAREEWRRLGRGGEPSALTLRRPQLAAARAERDAAAAELERAELDLERTRILAPYAGRVLERAVDPGQFVNRGTVLGRIHAIESVEVRLPLGARQQAFLTLPPEGAAASGAGLDEWPEVELEARTGDERHTWHGELVRVEGVDESTGQLVVVAEVREPWADPRAPLRIGRYVEARIAGRELEDVFVVPLAALREEREVLIVDDAGTIRRRPVRVVWTDAERAAVTEGLAAGELLVLTPLATVVEGAPVRAMLDGVAVEGIAMDRFAPEGEGEGVGGDG